MTNSKQEVLKRAMIPESGVTEALMKTRILDSIQMSLSLDMMTISDPQRLNVGYIAKMPSPCKNLKFSDLRAS